MTKGCLSKKEVQASSLHILASEPPLDWGPAEYKDLVAEFRDTLGLPTTSPRKKFVRAMTVRVSSLAD